MGSPETISPKRPRRGDCHAVGREVAGDKGIRWYLIDWMYRWKTPLGGHSKDLSHQVSSQKMRLQLVELKVSTVDPAFGQEPDYWGSVGRKIGGGDGSDSWQFKLEQRQEQEERVGKGIEC
jgi:hypothetical protein